MTPGYKIICINLKRRNDRKKSMESMFQKTNILDYHFFEAVDGSTLDPLDPRLKYFRHHSTNIHRKGALGCALSHLTIWKELVNNLDGIDYYVIMEDDVNLTSDFQEKLQIIMEKISGCMDVVYLGMTIEKGNYQKSRKYYCYDDSYTIHPLNMKFYAGGFFGYILSKKGAQKLIDHIELHGIKYVIDYIAFNCSDMDLYESHPHLIFTDSVQHSGYSVNSDIQLNYDKINLLDNKFTNNYQFDDYIFYPNKDSSGNDIMHSYADIMSLKKICDSMPECEAFNTGGWIKFGVQPVDKFDNFTDKFYTHDGLYVKKNYDKKKSLATKLFLLGKKAGNGPIKIFISKDSIQYSSHIVTMILLSLIKYRSIIVNNGEVADVIISHITDCHEVTHNTLNILISGEPFYPKNIYDICIDTKYESLARVTIYYPFIFSSIHEHRQSIDPKYYNNTGNKFCAYMYSVSHTHRIKYFNLLSTYKKVDALGKCCKNINIESTRYNYDNKETYNDIAVKYYTEYKFVLALENSFVAGYCTEKLMNPLIANSIPIYWGDSAIFKYINKKRVIYIQDFKSDEDLLEYIKYIDTDSAAYQKIVNENIYLDPNFTIQEFESQLQREISATLDINY